MTAKQSLSADLVAESAVQLRGFLDDGDPRTGINGWAVDLSDRQSALPVELCADAAVVAATRADRHREDIERLGFGFSRVGFRFDAAEVRSRMIDLGVARDARLWVRVAGTDFSLRSTAPMPSPADFIDEAGGGQIGLSAPAGAPAPVWLPSSTRPLPAALVALDLLSAFQAMTAEAADLLRAPMTPAAGEEAGYIEELAWEQDGLVWVFGWMKSRLPLHAPAVVVDGAKHPSALIAATHPRDDLPKDAHGIVGLLRTTWRPNGGGAPLLFLGNAAGAFLRSVGRPKLLSAEECVGRIEAHKRTLGGPFAKPLRRVFGSVANWAPDSARVSGAEVKARAEGVLVLPGFGCLVEGWALSPLHRVEGFMLRMGDSVLAAEARSISRVPRSDLLAVAPHDHHLAETGGFVAAFPGEVGRGCPDDVMLKVVCEGGVSTNHPVDAGAVRVLGGSARLDEILKFFPAVREEAFFPELARSVSEEVRRAVSEPVGFEVRAAERALVVAVPDDGSDMALLFSELALAARRRGRLPPVVVLARAGQHRSAVLSLFNDLRRNAAEASSLFFVPDPAYAAYLLGDLLGRVGADSFAFVAAGVFPTEAGWDALLDRLEAHGEEAAFLPVQEPAHGPAPAGRAPRAECFAWRRAACAAWLERAPLFLDGSTDRALTLPAGAVPASRGASARRGRRARPSVVATWVNEHLSTHGRAEAPDA